MSKLLIRSFAKNTIGNTSISNQLSQLFAFAGLDPSIYESGVFKSNKVIYPLFFHAIPPNLSVQKSMELIYDEFSPFFLFQSDNANHYWHLILL